MCSNKAKLEIILLNKDISIKEKLDEILAKLNEISDIEVSAHVVREPTSWKRNLYQYTGLRNINLIYDDSNKVWRIKVTKIINKKVNSKTFTISKYGIKETIRIALTEYQKLYPNIIFDKDEVSIIIERHYLYQKSLKTI